MHHEISFRDKPLQAWIDRLHEGDATTQAQAAMLLGELGGRLTGAIAVLRSSLEAKVLTASDPDLRTAASEALVRIGPTARSPLPVLIDNLKDDVSAVRWSAAHTLGELGLGALDAIPALTNRALYDSDARVRVVSAVAIWRIDKRYHRVVPQLIEALKDPDEIIRWVAAECLGDIGPQAQESVSALEAALQLPYRTRLVRMGIETALERVRQTT